MKFIVTKDNLHKGLALTSAIASKNANLPILNNILIQAEESLLQLVSTNLEIGVTSRIPGKVEVPGKTAVPARLLAEYVGLLPNDKIEAEIDGEELRLSCQSYKTRIKIALADDFPLLPEAGKDGALVCKAGDLRKAISQVVIAASLDETRPELSGVYMRADGGSLVLAATDSYRLSEKRLGLARATEGAKEAIVPSRTMAEISRIISASSDEGDTKLVIGDNQIAFFMDDAELVSRTIEGKYPDYSQIIPSEHKTKALVDKEALSKAIKNVSLFSRTGINDVHIKFLPESKEAVISATSSLIGKNTTSIPCEELEGEESEAVFNYRYLLDGLSGIETDKAVLRIIDNANPGMVLPSEEDGYQYLIMPIKQ